MTVTASPAALAPAVLAVASATVGAAGDVPGPGTVTFISTATDKVTRTVKLPTDPVALAMAANGSTAYVATVGSDEHGSPGFFYSVKPATGSTTKPLSIGTSPVAVAVNATGTNAYVVWGRRGHPSAHRQRPVHRHRHR